MEQFGIEIARQLAGDNYFKLDRREGRRVLLLVCLIHLLLALLVPVLRPMANLPSRVETQIFYEPKPEPMEERFFETNPRALGNEPPESANFSNRDQWAAQPEMQEKPADRIPTIDGTTEESQKIVEGDPLEPMAWPMDDNLTDSLDPTAESKVCLADGPMAIPLERKPHHYPLPTARPRSKLRLLPGELLKNPGATNSIGDIAVDARASDFGDYLSRLLEAISFQWEFFIERLKFPQTEGEGYVVVEVLLQPDGRIDRATILDTNLSQSAALICQDAIVSLSPFESWGEDMQSKFGEGKIIRIKFHYR